MQHHRPVEPAIFKRHVEGAAMVQGDELFEATALVELGSGGNEIGR